MSEIILAIGTGLCGVAVGYLFGVVTKRYMSPRVKDLQRVIEDEEVYHKKMIGRLSRRIAEYEQPPELQQMANQQVENPADLVNMLVSNIGGIKGLPRWVRPFLPAIQGWIKENPEQVQQLISKFLTPHKKEQDLSTDAL